MAGQGKYDVQKRLLGGYQVSFFCDSCQEPLIASLDDAGSKSSCVKCGAAFTVPGVKARERLEAKHREERVRAESNRAAMEAQRTAQRAAIAHAKKRAQTPVLPRYETIALFAWLYYLLAIAVTVVAVLIAFMLAYNGAFVPAGIILGAAAVNVFICMLTGQFITAFRDLVIAAVEIREEIRVLTTAATAQPPSRDEAPARSEAANAAARSPDRDLPSPARGTRG